MRAPNLYTFLLLPLLSAAVPPANNGAEPSTSATTTLTSTSTRTITHTMVQGTSTLTSVTAIALTAGPDVPKMSSLPDISAPSGVIDSTASLVLAPYPSSTPTRRPSAASSSVASIGTKAPAPSTTGIVTEQFKGAASRRLEFGIAELGAAAVGAMVLVGLV